MSDISIQTAYTGMGNDTSSVTVFTIDSRKMIKFSCGCTFDYEEYPDGTHCRHGYGWSVTQYPPMITAQPLRQLPDHLMPYPVKIKQERRKR